MATRVTEANRKHLANFLQTPVVEIAVVDLRSQSVDLLFGIDTWILAEIQIVGIMPGNFEQPKLLPGFPAADNVVPLLCHI